MNKEEIRHNKEERIEDRVSISLLMKISGATLILLLGIIGWNLIETYQLNANVAVHSYILSELKDAIDGTPGNPGIKTEIQTIYENKDQWPRNLQTTLATATSLTINSEIYGQQ